MAATRCSCVVARFRPRRFAVGGCFPGRDGRCAVCGCFPGRDHGCADTRIVGVSPGETEDD